LEIQHIAKEFQCFASNINGEEIVYNSDALLRRGFGFISPQDGGAELFAHHSQIKADGQFAMLEEGQDVEFTVGTSDRSGKAAAMNITGTYDVADWRSSYCSQFCTKS
jgi:cold shock CspA family protein